MRRHLRQARHIVARGVRALERSPLERRFTTRSGLSSLLGCEVRRVRTTPLAWMAYSTLSTVEVTYGGERGDLPDRFVLKVTRGDLPVAADRKQFEYMFYTDAELQTGSGPRCFAAEMDAAGAVALLLEDLSVEHTLLRWPTPPSPAQLEAAAGTLARFHARWWEHPQLGRFAVEPDVAAGVALTESFLASEYGGLLTNGGRRAFVHVGSMIGSFARRPEDPRSTLVHNDAHIRNFAFPVDHGGSTRLLDWQSYGVGAGADDVAYLLAIQGHPSRRREYEAALLASYHEQLAAHGVAAYGHDELHEDYRRGVARGLLQLALMWSIGLPPAHWLPKVDDAVESFIDLDCFDLS